MIHTTHDGRQRRRCGESHGRAVHPDSTVRRARDLRRQGLTYKRIGELLGVHRITVRDWVTYATRFSA